MYQNWLFKNRKREESPDASREKILNNRYLSYLYLTILKEFSLASGVDLEKTSSMKILEIGSAGGVTKKYFPSITTSDVRIGPGVDLVLDATNLHDIPDKSVDLVLAKDVLHHLPNSELHFKEMDRILKVDGAVVYAEPNWNLFSRIIFSLLHPEPYFKNQSSWAFTSHDPMYSNQALSWVIFKRDLNIFHDKFPKLSVSTELPTFNGIAFLISGGVFKRNRISSNFLIWLAEFERNNNFLTKYFSLTKIIVLRKIL